MKTKDVFTPGTFPTVTFVKSHLEEKTRHLRDALEAGGLVVSLSGPSKSGKTVFIQDNIGKDSLIHVTGAGVDHVSKLWMRVFDIIGTPVEIVETHDKSFAGGLEGKIGGDVGFFVKGNAEAKASGSWQNSDSRQEKQAVDHLQLFIRDVKESGFVLFIDDFHYVADDVKNRLAEEIKEAVRHGLNIVCASVPYHSDDVIRANKDLRGRIVILDFDYWDSRLLREIARAGFAELKMNVADALTNRLSGEAAGSPQLMQALCLNLCFELGIYETSPEVFDVENSPELFNKVCRRTALMTDYSSAVNIMNDGPKSRGQERKPHKLKDGSIQDVYPIVVKALAMEPPQLTFRYNGLTERIRALCEDEGPVGSSVTLACAHMARLANESSNDTIIEWDGENDVLDIRDPYLLFYLRWA